MLSIFLICFCMDIALVFSIVQQTSGIGMHQIAQKGRELGRIWLEVTSLVFLLCAMTSTQATNF